MHNWPSLKHSCARPDIAHEQQALQQQQQAAVRHTDRLPETGPVNWTRGELIGAGAFGRVYLGLNNQTGQLMAVKQARGCRPAQCCGCMQVPCIVVCALRQAALSRSA